MEPMVLGEKYDKIAGWWHERHVESEYGVRQFSRALDFSVGVGRALDVGCGAGGRFVRLLKSRGIGVTGIDVSKNMVSLARENHPDDIFMVQDICTFRTAQKFEFIVAWDSIFHLPLAMQEPVVGKLCDLLADKGVLIYTFGDAVGEHDDVWHDEEFHYSSVGINENLRILRDHGVTCKHLELDQWPQNHVYVIGQKC
ncbi:MAG: methyltransferase domain-containing protein [Gammaproteobacteria bacterium]|nr:methyltransferase domain-containing protein [Gammaproteobacteria bacterium]